MPRLLALAIVIVSLGFSAQAQQPAPSTPTAPAPQARPAAPPAPQAMTRLAFAQPTGPKCADIEAKDTDGGFKAVKVTRPKTGAPVGAITGINVPGKLGLDRKDPSGQHIAGVQSCDGGMSFALKAIVIGVTETTEEMFIMVPATLSTSFQLRSCSGAMNGACAWGAFSGFDKPIELGKFVGQVAVR